MNVYGLLGILSIFYSGFVVYIAVKKPEKLWEMMKIKMIRKILGDKGTVIFFYVCALLFLALGIWLFTV